MCIEQKQIKSLKRIYKLNSNSREMKQKLNLGCGSNYLKGYVNLDIGNRSVYRNKIKVDMIHNLNEFPYPFENNRFDEVLIEHTLEHLKDIFKVMKELTRITKPDGIIKIIVPHFSCYLAYEDPTHIQYFGIRSVNYFKGDNIIISKKLRASHNKVINLFSYIINLFPIIYERFFYGYFPVQECVWELKVKKNGIVENI